MSCAHKDFAASVSVGRVVDEDSEDRLLGLTIELNVECSRCGKPVEFYGLPIGVMTHMPTMSVDGLEARLVGFPQGETMPERPQVSAIFRHPEGKA